jgi:hypothetical protein
MYDSAMSRPISLPPVESVAKWTASSLVAVYGLGFTVVSLHYASFGFVELSPFKPRLIAAGVWFVVITGLTVALAVKLISRQEKETAGFILSLLWLFALLYVASAILNTVIFDYANVTPTFIPEQFANVFYLTVGTGVLLAINFIGKRYRESKPGVVVVASCVGIIALLAVAFVSSLKNVSFGLLAVQLWLTGYLTTIFLRQYRDGWWNEYQWIISTGFVLGTVVTFSSFVYPHIRSSWGGGAPVPVVVYLSKDSRILPGGELVGLLLDESDSGIFIARGEREHAIFLPRPAIAAVFYSKEPLPPEYLGGTALPRAGGAVP